MYLDEWRSIDRLLICFEESDCEQNQATLALVRVLHVLCQKLPKTCITVLTALNCPMQLDMLAVQIISTQTWIDESTVMWMRQNSFDAAILLTPPLHSPYAMAYLCYLAGIPIRVGQSKEFGGGVLSFCITPPLEDISLDEYHFHLLRSLGFSIDIDSDPNKVFTPYISV